MANTINLQATVNWAAALVKFQPQAINGNEPALSSANMVLQTMLGPPFRWPWNSKESSFVCLVDGTQDYTIALGDFGFLEKVWLEDPDDSSFKEITIMSSLARTDEKARLQNVAAQNDDNAGNITFRTHPAAAKAYTVTVLYQKKAPVLLSLGGLWSPVPDVFSYIFNWGYLAMMSLLLNDARFPIFEKKFIASLLGAQDGLSELEVNIFLGNWLEITRSFEKARGGAQQGLAARGQ